MIKNDFPYNSKNIYYAIHSTKQKTVSNVRLTRSENQGIYVSPDIFFLGDFIYNMIPPKNVVKELSFYINLQDVDNIINLFNKKLQKNKIFNKMISGMFKQDYTLWGYFKKNTIKKLHFIKSKNEEELVAHFIKNDYQVKVFFNLEDLMFLQQNLNEVKNGQNDNYNFIVE